MLGNHADYFMGKQMRERVLAITPNGGGRSMRMPDRELAGTATVRMKAGMQMPGPQRVVDSGYAPGRSSALPGMGQLQPSGALPGMGCVPPSKGVGCGPCGMHGIQRSGALPGMGQLQPGGALPGMGELSTPHKVAVGIAVVAGLWYFSRKKVRH